MKTTGLTWGEASNLLICGVVKFIEHDGGHYHNVYYMYKGVIHSGFHAESPTPYSENCGVFGGTYQVVEEGKFTHPTSLPNFD